jgi:outer membrane protein assembly factor BamB
MKKSVIFLGIASLLWNMNTLAQIDSQWRGPNRDGIYPGETLLKTWPEGGPKQMWSVDGLGEGYSSAAVTKDRIYVTGMIGGRGYLFAFDHKGKRLWKSKYGAEWSSSHPGARTTPTVVGDKIYLISALGQVSCFDKTGKLVWNLDMIKTLGGRNIEWGFAESPLIDGDRLFCTPGGKETVFAAINRHSGKVLWKTKGNGEKSGYCSPVMINYNGKRLILTMTAKSIIGIDADSGVLLWTHPHKTSYDVNPNTPLYHKGRLYTVSGYGTGGQMFKLSQDGRSITKVWAQNKLDSQIGSVILHQGTIIGSGHSNRAWYGVDWLTGKVIFSERAIGNKGNIIFADGLLYCYSERGDMALVKPEPDNFQIISSFKIKKGSGPHWAHPVIKDGFLYVRHGNILIVYDIKR